MTLSRHPLLRDITLRAGNRLRRRRGILAALVFAMGAVALLCWVSAESLREPVRQVLEWLTRHGFVVGALVGGHAMLLVSRRRRRLCDEYRTSWLSAAPISRTMISRVITLRVAANAIAHLIAILLGLMALQALGKVPLLQSVLAPGVGAGFAAGCIFGWFLPHRSRAGWEASRYAPGLDDRWQGKGGSRALAHWPIAQVFAWHRPENSRFVIVAVLFCVQGGSSMAGGLAVVGAWLIAIYLASLLQAVIVSGRAAAAWLRPMPVPFATFAWSVAKRALLHQSIGVAVAAALGMGLGGPVMTLLYFSALWMTIVLCVTAVTLAASYRGERAPFRFALSLVGLAAVEVRAHGWGIALALAMAALYLKRATNSRATTS